MEVKKRSIAKYRITIRETGSTRSKSFSLNDDRDLDKVFEVIKRWADEQR